MPTADLCSFAFSGNESGIGGGKVEYFFERSPFMEFLCATEMDDATVALSEELMKLRTGGASPGVFLVGQSYVNLFIMSCGLNH